MPLSLRVSEISIEKILQAGVGGSDRTDHGSREYDSNDRYSRAGLVFLQRLKCDLVEDIHRLSTSSRVIFPSSIAMILSA